MDFIGRHRRRGADVRREGVIGVAVLQPPDAGVVHGLAARCLDRGDLGVERLGDWAVDAPGRLGCPVAGNALGGRLLGQGLGHRTVGARQRPQGLHLRQGLVEHEVGRRDAVGDVLVKAVGLLGDDAGKGVHARQEGLGVGLGLDRVLAVEEIGRRAIGAGQLAEDVGAGAAPAAEAELVEALFRRREAPHDRVVIDAIHAGQLVARNGLEHRHGAVQAVERRQVFGNGRGRQLRLQPGQFALVEAERSRRLRRMRQAFLEDGVESVTERLGGSRIAGRIRSSLGGAPNGRRTGYGGGGNQQMTTIEHFAFLFLSLPVRDEDIAFTSPPHSMGRCHGLSVTEGYLS